MKSPKGKVEAVCSRETVRYALTEVNYAVPAGCKDGDRGVLTASNGKGLASIPVEAHAGDTPGMIGAKHFKTARKIAGRKNDPIIRANGDVTFGDGSTGPRRSDLEDPTFPDVEMVAKGPKEARKGKNPTVVLDVAMLKDIADALDADPKGIYAGCVKLWIEGDSKAIYIEPCDPNGPKGSYALLMPRTA